MDVTPRLQQILLLMLEQEVIPVKELAKQIQVSKRTVQRELEYISGLLKKYNIRFCSKTGIGVWLEGTGADKQKLKADLEGESGLDACNRGERRKRLIFEILKDKNPQKLYYYGNLFGVSEATVSSDLESVEPWFEGFGLKIVRKQGYGILLQGSEKNYRQAMRNFIDENIDSQMVREAYEDRNQPLLHALTRKGGNNIYNILDQEILRRVVNCILCLNDRRILNLTENSYMGLVIHITIAINRILKQEIIEAEEPLMQVVRESDEYQLAQYIAHALEAEFRIAIPEVEAAYIYLHIKGAKRQNIEMDERSKNEIQEQKKMMQLLNDMIDAYDKEKAYLLKQDEEFIRGLLAHLLPTCTRLSGGMRIKNPLLEQIKLDYPEIFEKCRKVSRVLEQELSAKVPEEETGFLAIHFGAAILRLEEQKEQRRKVYIGVVCASGIGISRLMLTKIEKYFGIRAELTAYGKEDITPYVLERTDFLVSTIPLGEADAEVLYVSPLLVEEDMNNIERLVLKYQHMPKRREEENEFTRQLEKVNYMAGQIKAIVHQMQCVRTSEDTAFEELLEEISERMSPYQDRQEMIRKDIRKREALGTQVFPELEFALLHTRTEGVVKPEFALYYPESGGSFSDDYLKQVQVVIVMLLPLDEHLKENSQILGYISEQLIENEEFMETIRRGEKEEIQGAAMQVLKQFFNSYLDKVKVQV